MKKLQSVNHRGHSAYKGLEFESLDAIREYLRIEVNQ